MESNWVVHDLAWVMEGPGLLDPTATINALLQPWTVITDAESSAMRARGAAALVSLQQEPTPLLNFVAEHRKSGRLGNYFEMLVFYWLQEILGHRRVIAGVPIRRQGETLGELDFVFESGASGAPMHWEVAVKYYLCVAPDPSAPITMDQLVGQRLADRLDLKVKLSLERQLPLARGPEASERLRELGFTAPQSRLFMRGRLFYPVHWEWAGRPAPLGVSANHARGWWSAFAEGQTALPQSSARGRPEESTRWALLPKPRWLAPASGTADATLDRAELIAAMSSHFAKSANAVQVAELQRGPAGQWHEASRGMILRPGWPGTAREEAAPG